MKSRTSVKYFLAFSTALALICCRERMITPITPAGERVVLVEEFTGKGCTNCPNGARELESLLAIYGEQLVVVSIHANWFADPVRFPLGQYDLRTDEGELLFDFLGPVIAYPSASVNRRKFNNQLQHGPNVWAGYIAEEATLEPEVELSMTPIYNPLIRHLDLVVDGRAKVEINQPLSISVMITESGIVDAQDDADAGGIVEDYVHNHVLRDMLTPYDGLAFATALAAGEDFSIPFEYTLPAEWNSAKCSIVALVSRDGGGDLYVLQAAEVHVE